MSTLMPVFVCFGRVTFCVATSVNDPVFGVSAPTGPGDGMMPSFNSATLIFLVADALVSTTTNTSSVARLSPVISVKAEIVEFGMAILARLKNRLLSIQSRYCPQVPARYCPHSRSCYDGMDELQHRKERAAFQNPMPQIKCSVVPLAEMWLTTVSSCAFVKTTCEPASTG